MSRLIASLALVAFVSGPLLQLRCEMACATDDAADCAAVPTGLDVASIQTTSVPDDCPLREAASPVLVSSRALAAGVLMTVETIASVAVSQTSAIVIAFGVLPPGGPPGNFTLPLRV